MDNFFTNHTMGYLIILSIFPRFGLLFCGIQGTIFFWIGWLFLPRVMIAILATLFYSTTNPILVILSWISAFSGESAEKKFSYKYSKKMKNKIKQTDYEVIDD